MGGNPARLLRLRFDDRTIEQLLAIRWWEWSDERIADNVGLLCSGAVERFVQLHGDAVVPRRRRIRPLRR